MQPNSIILLSLTHYACVVGGDTYWNEFDTFCKWATREFRATTVPFFVPFPTGLSQTYLSRLHHAMTAARARYMGDFKGGVDWRYTIWQPLTNYMGCHSAEKEKIACGPVVLGISGRVVIECPGKAWMGCPGDFSKTLPSVVEQAFFSELLTKLEADKPHRINFKRPSEEALTAGFELKAPPSVSDLSNCPTVHLYGTSILKEAAESVEYSANKDNKKVVNHCREDSNDMRVVVRERNIPILAHKQDCVVLAFMGNELFKMDNHKKFHKTFHYTNPKALNDQDVHKLVDLTGDLVKTIKKKFDGSIYVIGPMPRMIEKCCKTPNHKVQLGPMFKSSLQYAFFLNKFLQVNPIFSDPKVHFVPYDVIFGVGFDESYLRDGVHLTADANAIFAQFIADIPSYKPKKVKATKNPKPSFFTWTENIQTSAKTIRSIKTTPLTSTPRARGRPRSRLGPRWKRHTAQ